MWCTGFVLDLITKGGFCELQWFADYLKLPLRFKRNSPCHKLGVGGELCTLFFLIILSCHLPSKLSLALQLWIKLHSFFPQQRPAPHCSIQGTALRGSEGTARPGHAASTSLELRKPQQPLPWLEGHPGHGRAAHVSYPLLFGFPSCFEVFSIQDIKILICIQMRLSLILRAFWGHHLKSKCWYICLKAVADSASAAFRW